MKKQMMNDLQNVVWVDSTDSTNILLSEMIHAERLPEGFLVVADYQLKGRGQMGNYWHSEKGKNLLFSFVIYPTNISANEQFIISRITSLAIKNMLSLFVDNIKIKWPNDIYWNHKKIAGMLIENDLIGKKIDTSIIGIGLNVNQEQFPDYLPDAVSLSQITRMEMDKKHLLELFMKEFFLIYSEFQKNGGDNIEYEYMKYLYRANELHWFEDENGQFQAQIYDVRPSGHLVVKTLNDDELVYAFKEIIFVNK